MDYSSCEWEYIKPAMHRKRDEVRRFLLNQGLRFEENCELTIIARKSDGDNDEIICAGSIAGNVLKCIAVEKEYSGMGFAAALVSKLVSFAYMNGKYHLFLFTSPKNKSLFEDLQFYQIAEAPEEAILMENKQNGLDDFLKTLGTGIKEQDQIAGAIVANCNPFTNGHKALIEYAADRCDILHIFVLMEEQSTFPAQDRFMLVKEGVADLENVRVHQARDYIISSGTFPTYFLKQESDGARTHARLDLNLFSSRIAPYLGITKRFAGEEPICKLTAIYNEEMNRILPAHGIEFITIPRITKDGTVISASYVRELLTKGELEKTESLVPSVTYEYLRRMTK